ncbi:MAG: AbrB/MazE/SpoVT family DNA-binding domain-containing protein [Candidatus Binataceae bacterium]
MAELTKVGPRFQVTIPLKVRSKLGLARGELMEAEIVDRGAIILRRKQVVDYDPELERDLADAEADVKAGRVYGPYDAKQAIPALRGLVARERKRISEDRARTRAKLSATRTHARGLHP